MKVVIPAAGLGSRFLPQTKSMPKEMLPVLNRPVIQYVVEQAVAAGGDDIIIVTGRGKQSVEDHFASDPELAGQVSHPELRRLESLVRSTQIRFVHQRAPLGLAHAIACTEREVGGEPFGVLLGDSIHLSEPPVLQQLAAARDGWAQGGSAVDLELVAEERVHQYGIVQGALVGDRLFRVERLVEKPQAIDAPSRLALTGAYLLSPSIFDAIRETPAGPRGDVELTDALDRLARREPMVGAITDGTRFDTGTPPLWFETNVRFALHEPLYRELLLRTLREEGLLPAVPFPPGSFEVLASPRGRGSGP
jgi:UTP--glucose-1-phosphate uridylyltransferase